MTAQTETSQVNWIADAVEYSVDAAQRTLLYWDIMRKRGNTYIDHRANGQPPVLVFDYTTIIDGHELDPPANYSLVQIIDHRGTQPDRRSTSSKTNGDENDRRGTAIDRRDQPKGLVGEAFRNNRPILIIDPRAGHGPGIGGSKLDSQIGMALNAGHPVYFLIFSIYPEPNQTLMDVWQAEIHFLEEIRRRHPKSPKPAVIGNCQGGWAAALIGAERPDITGPMAFNGSPLSYWSGLVGVNPMRYAGGLLGGSWVNSFMSDLGNGLFDGADLVANFENLNPANTLWSKQYNLYSKVDTEEKRYLNFEKWWGGFYFMTREEIATVVNCLFVGNKLEQGSFEIGHGKSIDLNKFKAPVVLFASFGDNITPPQQAFNWVAKVYGSSQEIKRKGQVIVLVLHKSIGHLGIFVSAKIARTQHKEIIGSFDMLEFLPPGLYELVFEEENPKSPEQGYSARFVEREVDDILGYDDGLADEEAFYSVRTVSTINNTLYQTFVSPWIKMLMTEPLAEGIRQLHPLRVQRYTVSDLNPLTWPIMAAAPMVKESRRQVSADNIFLAMEKNFSQNMVSMLNAYRDARDLGQELLFKMIYENPWTQMLFPPPKDEAAEQRQAMEERLRKDNARLRNSMHQGGCPDAVVRILLAIMTANRELTREEYDTAEGIVRGLHQFKSITPGKLREIVKTQARLLQVDREAAITALPQLIPDPADRTEAMAVIDQFTTVAGRELNTEEIATKEAILFHLKESEV
ncbi:conserved uncharacterized protein, DUF3141 [Desulfosarcina variabilis str. Montpellier]|uniref:DUF3141 domain-containing protein n=1 Tax=Desulfosarcina variabilis TaxID=2300 RepID=UPI003AFAB08F